MSAYSVSLQGSITGYTKITAAMKQYNALGAVSQKEQQNFATAVALTNTKLGSYLTGLNGAKASLSGYGVSLIASTAKTVGLTIATTALNAALTFGISAIVTGAISAFATWINSSKKITEAAEEAKDKISSINDDLKTNTETVENAKQRYAELAQEVENLGKVSQSQGSLSTDEYKEFLDLSNQLAGVFPQLTKGYDDNGNAILDLSGSVDTIVGSLDDLLQKEKDLANQKIMDEFPDVYKGYIKDLGDAQAEVKSAQNEFDKIQEAYRNIGNGKSIQMAFNNLGSNTDSDGKITMIGDYESWLDTLGLTYKETVIEGGKLVTAVGDIDTAFTNKLETAKKNLDYAKQQLEGEESSIGSYLNTWLQTEFTYNQIDDTGLQTAVQDMIMNFDFSNLPEDVDKDNWNEVSEYLRRNILFAINDIQDDPDISKAISEVFTNQDLTPDEKADYLQQIKDYFDNELGKDNAISISLQPQIDDTDALQKNYQKTLDRFKSDTSDTSSKELDSLNKQLDEQTQSLADAKENLQNEYDKISGKNGQPDFDLGDYEQQIKDQTFQTKFGNIDMDKRQIIHWSDELKKTYADALASWDYNPEVGGIDTVFGASMRIGESDDNPGVEIAFSPILQTDNGAVFLSEQNVEDYLNAIYKEAAKDGVITEDEILNLDADPSKIGFKVGENYVSGLIAGVDGSLNYDDNGNWAEFVGRIMHFMGKDGAIQLAQSDIDEYNKQIEETKKKIEEVSKGFDDSDKIKDFFDTEGINTTEEIDEFNKVTEGIKRADDAIQKWNEHKKEGNETPISSFEDAWTSLKASTDDDLKGQTDDLLKLAEAGQLTGNALEGLAGGQELMKNTGLSADELAKKINGLVNASTQLNSMSGQISKMSDLLADKKNGETASASDLAGFDATVRGLDSWEQFEKVMGDSKSSMKDCQEAADALATEWVNNSEFLDNLTEDNKGYYETQLKNMGVENAEQVVTAALAQKKNELAIQQEYETACKEAGITASADLATVTGTEIQALLDEGKISIDTASKLAELVTKKRLANGISLTTSGDIQNLAELAGMTTKVGKLLAEFARIKQLVNTGMIPQAVADTKLEGLQSEIEKQINGGNNTNIGVDISPSGSSTYKAPSSKKSKSSKDSKSTIDWIDRKLSVLQTKIDLTQSKFDNLFNLKSPKNLKKNIDKVTKSLSSAQSKAESFKKKMSSVNLDSSTKKKVQNGTVKLSDYSKTDQKRIKQYQKYYSSYEKYATKAKSLQKELNTLNSSGGKINNLNTQIKQMKALESATSKAIKKYSSYASGVKLSKSLKNKVKNGDYTISDYDSKTQEQITKYQNYIDKIAELRKQLQELKGDIQDTTIEKYQLIVDDADAKRSKSEAWGNVESVNDSKKMNSHVEYQKQQVKQSYAYQIKIAKAEHDSAKVSQLRAERLKEIRELTYQEAENITTAYDNQLKLNDAKRQGIQSALSLAETRGDQIGSAYYSSQISLNNSDLNDRKDERSKLLGKLKTLKKYSEEWYKVYDLLQNVNGEISNLENNTAELQRKQYNLKWDRFDELQNKLSDITTEASFLIDLLDSDNFFDDKGMITDDGVTAMGLSLENYDVYLAQAQKYKEKLAELERDYAAGDVSYDDYTSRLREYTQAEQNAIKSANELKKSVVSYVKQGLDAQNEALSEEIEKRKKLLDQEKTERDFNKDVEERSKKIARLKRQIAILENDDSDSNRKTLRELKSNLKDLQDEQDDKFYDKSISDQEDSLNTMLENSKKQAEEYLKDTDKVFADALVYVNAHADQVSTRLEKLAQDTGYDISNNITSAWKGSGDAVGTYADTMSQNVPKITSQIALITSAWNAQCEAADKAAAASARASSNSYSKGSDYGLDDDTYTTYTKSEIKDYITKSLNKAGKNKSYYGALNQYLYDKTGGKVLSTSEEVTLAKMLGVSVKNDLSGKNDRQNILDALKKKNIKFANGGVLGDLVKVSGEDGLFIGSTGESVLTKEQTQALMKFAPIVPQMSNLMDNMKNVVPVNNRSVSEPHIEINTTVEGVATDKIVKDFENVATRQAENVVKRINSATYAKGVRRI